MDHLLRAQPARPLDEAKVSGLLTELEGAVNRFDELITPVNVIKLADPRAVILLKNLRRNLRLSRNQHEQYSPNCEALLQQAVLDANSLVSLIDFHLAVPKLGEKFLALFVTPARLEEAIGDMEQGYLHLWRRHGVAFATFWYYFQVIGIATRSLAAGLIGLARYWLPLF